MCTIESYKGFQQESKNSSPAVVVLEDGRRRNSNQQKQVPLVGIEGQQGRSNTTPDCLGVLHLEKEVNRHEHTIPQENCVLREENVLPNNPDVLKEGTSEFFVITIESPEQDHMRSGYKNFSAFGGGGATLSTADILSLTEADRAIPRLVEQSNARNYYNVKNVRKSRSVVTRTNRGGREDRTDATTTSVSTATMMDLFHGQKYTCPDRVKQLHHLGTQNLLLKKTQAYIKELQESRRTIRFEMELQRRREEKKHQYRQSLKRESCCERLYSYSWAKQQEAKQRIQQIQQAKNERGSKSFNVYAAFHNEYVF
jgi:hypothetical protein